MLGKWYILIACVRNYWTFFWFSQCCFRLSHQKKSCMVYVNKCYLPIGTAMLQHTGRILQMLHPSNSNQLSFLREGQIPLSPSNNILQHRDKASFWANRSCEDHFNMLRHCRTVLGMEMLFLPSILTQFKAASFGMLWKITRDRVI